MSERDKLVYIYVELNDAYETIVASKHILKRNNVSEEIVDTLEEAQDKLLKALVLLKVLIRSSSHFSEKREEVDQNED